MHGTKKSPKIHRNRSRLRRRDVGREIRQVIRKRQQLSCKVWFSASVFYNGRRCISVYMFLAQVGFTHPTLHYRFDSLFFKDRRCRQQLRVACPRFLERRQFSHSRILAEKAVFSSNIRCLLNSSSDHNFAGYNLCRSKEPGFNGGGQIIL